LCSPFVEVFNHFKDEQGNFRACIHDDLKGMLSLYEASYFLVEGENILEDARDFTTKNLENYVKKRNTTEYLSELVSCLGASIGLEDAKIGGPLVHQFV
jgi:transcription elongation factor GreA-like protein